MHANRYEIGGVGDRYEIGDPGAPGSDNVEIGLDGFPHNISLGAEPDAPPAEGPAAVRRVIEAARDGRQPAPAMRALDVDAPESDDVDDFVAWFSDVAVGCGTMIGVANPFPLVTKYLQRGGAGMDRPRIVRVDTEESYAAFREASSPEMAELRDRIADLAGRLEEHLQDPHAHEDIALELDEVEAIGAEVSAKEAAKAVDMHLPPGVEGNVEAWEQDDFVCASICLPGPDGKVRICTSMRPKSLGIEEMEQHAASANVSAADVVGYLPEMGCILGAATLVKEMAAAAPALLARPEVARAEPCLCRIEPKASPAMCALIALASDCARGDKQACAEWDALASAAEKGGAEPVARAMREAASRLARHLRRGA